MPEPLTNHIPRTQIPPGPTPSTISYFQPFNIEPQAHNLSPLSFLNLLLYTWPYISFDMAAIAAATAPAALCRSGRSRSSAFKVYALFSKKPAAPPPKAKAAAVTPLDEELAKWYGPDRRIYLPEGLLDRSEVPEYLNGEVPGE